MKTSNLFFGLFLCFSLTGQAQIPTDTYFRFPLDGNAVDISGYNHSGTITGGVTTTTDRYGQLNGALQFNGIDGYIDIPYNTSVGTADFSVTYWANPTASNAGFVLTKEQSAVPANQFRMGSSGDYFGCFSDNSNTYGGGIPYVPSTGVWGFYTIVRQGNSIKLYVNGVYKSALTTAGTINHSNTLNYRIGALYSGSFYFNGKIDDLRMYKHALSTDEITALYNFNYNSDMIPFRIESLTPVKGKAGATVTITGKGFSSTPSENTVLFGDVKATVNSATTTSLTVTVPAGAGSVVPVKIIADGKVAHSNTCSTPVFTFINSPNISLVYQKTNFVTGTNPYDVASGDFNQDGKTDLVTANKGSNGISILIGDGNGGFSSPADLVTGTGPQSVTADDFNGDGKLDLATANYDSRNISVFLGNGNGSFAPAINYATGQNPCMVKTGDFNGDGKVDLVTANFVVTCVSVLYGNGDGTFPSKTDFFLGFSALAVATGDFNADGKTDLVTTNGNNSINVWQGNGDGTFFPAFNYPVGNIPQSVAVGDFNRDGKDDLAVANKISHHISILTGDGAGHFTSSGNYAIAVKPYMVKVADFNGDGILDLVTSNVYEYSFSVTVLLGKKDGTFAEGVYFPIEGVSYSVLAADFNRDGKADIAATNFETNNVSVLLNASISVVTKAISNISFSTATGNGSITDFGILNTATAHGVCWNTSGLPVISDSKSDLGSTSSPGDFSVSTTGLRPGTKYYMRAFATNMAGVSYDSVMSFITPTFKLNSLSPVKGTTGTTVTISGNGFSAVKAENIVYFGAIKATVTASTPTSLTVTVPAGAGSVVPVEVYVNGASASSLTTATPTFNIVNSPNLKIIYNKTDLTVGSSVCRSVASADLNEDGKADLVVLSPDLKGVNILKGDGDGRFSLFSSLGNFEHEPTAIAICDLNGDGKLDIVTTSSYFNNVRVLFGDGNLGFTVSSNIPVGAAPVSITTGDYNLDNKIDLITANFGSGNFSVLLGKGDGTFQTAVSYALTSNPNSITSADFNGDGILDIASTNSNNTDILLGNGDGTFILKSSFTIAGSTIKSGDFNNDGEVDLAISIHDADAVCVILGDGTGSFGAQTYFTVDDAPTSIAVGDFNGDGKSDISTANTGSNNVSILLGDGTGSLASSVNFPTAQQPASILSGDFNNDGQADLATVNLSGSVSVLLNASMNISTQSPVNIYSTSANGKGNITSMGKLTPVAYGVCWNTTGMPTVSDNKIDKGATTQTGDFTCAMTGLTPNTLHYVRAYATNSATTVYGEELTFTTLPLQITSFSPVKGSTGTTVTISGSGFSTIPAENIVYFGDVKATVSASTNSTLTVTVPAGAGSVVPVSVVKDGSVLFSTSCSTPFFNVTITPSALLSYRKTDVATGGTYATSTAIGDFNNDGYSDIVVTNSANNIVSVLLGDGKGTFAGAVNYTVGTNPRTATVGDFNADGKPDIAVTNFNSNTVSILTGNGNGTFANAVSFGVGFNPISIAVNDFNNDKKADIVTADYGMNKVSILLGDGKGGFATSVRYSTGANPVSVSVGDFNKDGNTDIAVANNGSDKVSILLGYGNGTFASPVSYLVGITPYSVSKGDFNADGKDDLAVATIDNVNVLLGNGDGTFSTAVSYTAGSNPISTSVGDFNGDGKIDLAVANNLSNDVSLLSGNGTGTFAPAVNILTGNAPYFISVGDFDGNGIADMVTANSTSNNITVLKNALYTVVSTQAVSNIQSKNAVGNGSILELGVTNPTAYGICWNTKGLPTITDNKVDKGTTSTLGAFTANISGLNPNTTYYARAFATNSAGTYYGEEVSFTTFETLSVSSISPSSGTVGSTVTISGSGFSTTPANNIVYFGAIKANVISSTATILSVTVPAGAGSVVPITVTANNAVIYSTGTLTHAFKITNTPPLDLVYSKYEKPTGNHPQSIAIGDFNSDKKSDMAIACSGSGLVNILLGDGIGNFIAASNCPTGGVPACVAVGDFNGDGIQDLTTSNSASDNISILTGNGDGTFAPAINYSVGDNPTSIAVDDFNGDGKTDLVVTNNGWSSISILMGNGNGTFSSAVYYVTMNFPNDVTIGDFNRDGIVDIAIITNYGISVLMGNGDGTFATAVTNNSSVDLNRSIKSADFNNDGKLDLVAGDYTNGNVCVLLGNGDGTFAPFVNYFTGSNYTAGVAIGDFNGDGKIDIASSSEENGGLSILPGNGNGTFSSPLLFQLSDVTIPQFITVGDLNNDGKADFVVGTMDNSVSVLLNTSLTVNTLSITDIGVNTATANGSITVLGATNPTSYGICWNTTGTPTVSDSKIDKGATSVIKTFNASITGLLPNTTYYVRAYATNISGTCYGSEISFTTSMSTGFDELNQSALSIYPNPAINGFILNIGDQKSLLSIYDLSGSLMLNIPISGKSYIDITNLPCGVYIVKANGMVKKLIKKQ